MRRRCCTAAACGSRRALRTASGTSPERKRRVTEPVACAPGWYGNRPRKDTMNIVHLTASPFFGGPERQMLGLARSLPAPFRSSFLSFPERGLCQPFLDEAGRHGFAAEALAHN